MCLCLSYGGKIQHHPSSYVHYISQYCKGTEPQLWATCAYLVKFGRVIPEICSLAVADIQTHTCSSQYSARRTTHVSRYQKGKTNLDFTEARESEWQWHQLGHMQVCSSLQTDNHPSTPHHSVFLLARCPSCRPTNSVKALKAQLCIVMRHKNCSVGRKCVHQDH